MIRFLLLSAALAFAPAFSVSAQEMVFQGTAKVIPMEEETPAPATMPAPVVLELFTSQGCAFCPPADELIGQLAQQQNVIALSCHVDYFGIRKNSLGKAFCTSRQNMYNRLIGTGPRYTPQLVVNGHMDMIGYEAGKVSMAIMKARGEKIYNIPITPAAGNGAYTFALPAMDIGAEPVSLWIAVYDGPKSVTMTEGNNFGKKITYYNVVSKITDMGSWDGAAMSRNVYSGMDSASAGFAVIAQNTRTGRVIAAGSINR